LNVRLLLLNRVAAKAALGRNRIFATVQEKPAEKYAADLLKCADSKNKDLAACGIPRTTGIPPGYCHVHLTFITIRVCIFSSLLICRKKLNKRKKQDL